MLKIFLFLVLFVLSKNLVFAESCDSIPSATINISLDFSESKVPNEDGGWQNLNKLNGV